MRLPRRVAARRSRPGSVLVLVMLASLPGSPASSGARGRPPETLPDPIAAAWSVGVPATYERPMPDKKNRFSDAPLPWDKSNTAPSTTVFEKFRRNPVLRLGSNGSLGAGHVEYPSVVRAGHLLWMFYSAYGAHHRWEIAAAVSPDGIRWTKLGVVLAPDTTAGAWDSATIAFPCVIYSEKAPPAERFRMWYAGKRDHRYRGIGLATSPDGRHWRREGRVLAAGKRGEWDREQIGDPSVIDVDGGYRMYYNGTASSDALLKVGVAASPDGRHWVKLARNPVYPQKGKGIYTVDAVKMDRDFLLFTSAPNGHGEYQIHVVRSADGLAFNPRDRKLVLEPARDNTWDHALVYGMDVVLWGDTMYMWFNGLYTTDVIKGGEIGLARTTRQALARLWPDPIRR